jgi:2-methylfumaryl-CoA isomerase
MGGVGILKGFRLIEGSAFVAAPLGGMTLSQLEADVIRSIRLAVVSITTAGRLQQTATCVLGGIDQRQALDPNRHPVCGRPRACERARRRRGSAADELPTRGWLAY